MLKNIIILLLTVFISPIFAYTSVANPQQIVKNVICKEKDIFKKFHEQNQDEKLIWYGIAEDGSKLTELYESTKTKKWTILETDTNGISCATIGDNLSTFLKSN